MQLIMQQEITQIVPQNIGFNYLELKEEIASKLERYKNMAVTEADISGAKKDKAALNNLAKALNDQRIAQQRDYMRPFDEYKAQVDELIRMIKEPVDTIDQQLKAFDFAIKEARRVALRTHFEDNVGTLAGLISFEKIWNERWLNATFKQANAEQEICEALNRARNDLAIIQKMHCECEDRMMDKYLQTLDMSAALAEKTRFEELQKNIEEAKHRAAKEALERAVPVEEPTAVQASTAFAEPTIEPIAVSEVPQPIDIRIWVTGAQKTVLKAFLAQNNIKYGSVK